jgi:hypothetical protein
MLRSQARNRSVCSDVGYADRPVGENRKGNRSANNLSAAFTVRAVDIQHVFNLVSVFLTKVTEQQCRYVFYSAVDSLKTKNVSR